MLGRARARTGHERCVGRRKRAKKEPDDAGAACKKVVEAVGADHREERRPERDEHVRPQAGCLLVQLALEPDRPAERSCSRESGESTADDNHRGGHTASGFAAGLLSLRTLQVLEYDCDARRPAGPCAQDHSKAHAARARCTTAPRTTRASRAACRPKNAACPGSVSG